jgi:hypothetical protein
MSMRIPENERGDDMTIAPSPNAAELPLRHGGDPLTPRLPLDELMQRRDERMIPFRFPNGVVGWVTTNVEDFKAALVAR